MNIKDKYYQWNETLSPNKKKTVSILADLIIGFYKIPHEAITGEDLSSKKILSKRERNRKALAASATGMNVGILGYGLLEGYSEELLKLFALSTTAHRITYGLSLTRPENISTLTKKYTIATSIILATTLGDISSNKPIRLNRKDQAPQYIQRNYNPYPNNEAL